MRLNVATVHARMAAMRAEPAGGCTASSGRQLTRLDAQHGSPIFDPATPKVSDKRQVRIVSP
jgi:hypothetical protein